MRNGFFIAAIQQIILAQDRGKITAIDIIELRRVVLGIQDSWRYVPNWHYEFLSEPVFLVDELHQKTLNCIAVKTGDVN